MLEQVVLNGLVRFEDVDGENNQILVLEFLGNVIDQLRFPFAVLAPRCPELKENDLAFYGFIIELLPGDRSGAEARSGLASFVAGNCRAGECQKDGEDDVASSRHAAE